MLIEGGRGPGTEVPGRAALAEGLGRGGLNSWRMRLAGGRVDFVLMLLAVALLAGWQSTGRRTNALVGSWENPNMTLDFRPDGSLQVVYKERKYGGRSGSYRVDFSRHPAELDVRLENKKVFFSSCEITPTGDLRISDDSQDPAERPRTFGRHTLVLNRLSDKVATGR